MLACMRALCSHTVARQCVPSLSASVANTLSGVFSACARSCALVRARDHALLVVQQRVEFFTQWCDFRAQPLRVDALRIAATHPFQLRTEAMQRAQAEVHLACQHRQPRRNQYAQGDGAALAERGDIGIQRAAIGGDHGYERFAGAWQSHLLHACAQGLLQRSVQVARGRAGSRRR